MAAISSISRFRETPQAESRENWKSIATYHAQTTFQEKICRVGNIAILGPALYGVYSCLTGPMGAIAYVGIALAARKVASTVIGYCVYPAALTSMQCGEKRSLQKMGQQQIQALRDEGFFCKKITLYKSGTKYSAVLAGHSSTINNGKWTVQALGNMMTMEPRIKFYAKRNAENRESNTLLINGPSVSASGGWPTRYQMGAGFEAGIQFLEKKVRATHIAMRGISLGGGMMAEAILNHDFSTGQTKKIRYLSISHCTFSRLSTIVESIVGPIAAPIFYITDTELDGIGAAKKLSQLNIRQIIIQGIQGSDDVIPDSVSLAHALHQKRRLPHKVFLESANISHDEELPRDIKTALNREICNFFDETSSPKSYLSQSTSRIMSAIKWLLRMR